MPPGKMKKTTIVLFTLVAVGCGKTETPAPAGSAAAPATPAASAAAPTTPPAESAAPTEEKPKAAQKGLEAGQVIVGYLQDTRDEGQCAALPAPEAEKAKWDEKKLGEVAKMMKSKLVPACPSDNVVGTCKMMGMLVNYSGPKYAEESAKKHCSENRGKWIE